MFYGPLAEAMQAGRREPQEVQAALWIATENDVVAFLDLEDGYGWFALRREMMWARCCASLTP